MKGVNNLDEIRYREIIDLLKDAHKGLTIDEISKKLDLSRITTTKYLNSLFVSGQVNMRKVGPAKLFTLTTRLPAEQILRQSPDPILVLDESYLIREVSDSFLSTFSVKKEDLQNMTIGSTPVGGDLIDRIRNPVKKGIAGTESVANIWIPVQKEWKAFRIRILPLVFGWGDKGIVITFEDRTGEIMAQEENALLADLVNASPAAITVHDLQGNFLYSNKKNLDLHGYSLNEFLNLNLSRIEVHVEKKHLSGRMEGLKKSGEETFETIHCRKDGRQIPLEVHAKAARWGDRDVIISIATDISERKRSEQALLESERRLGDIINFLPDATLVIDTGGKVLAWNRAMEEMTGVPAEEMIGKGDYEYAIPFYHRRRPLMADLVMHEDQEVLERYPEIRKEGSSLIAEIFLPRFNNGREAHLWFTASPLYDTAGNLIGAIESIRDITGLRQPEKGSR